MSNLKDDSVAEIRAAERERIRAIMSSPEAGMLPDQAAVLALGSPIASEHVREILAQAARLTRGNMAEAQA